MPGEPGSVLPALEEVGLLEFLLRLSDRLRELEDPVDVAQAAAEMLGEHLRVSRTGYGEIDPPEEIVSVKRDWTDGTMASLAGEARILDAFGPEVVRVVRAGRALVVEDCLTDPRVGKVHAATWASIGTRSLIVVPLIKGGRFRSILYLHEPEPRRWTEAEASLAREVAERTWEAVERARAEAALRDSEERHRILFEQAAVGVAHTDLDGRWLMVNQRLCDILGYAQDELVGRTFQSLTHPDDLEGDLPLVRALDAGEIPSVRREKRYIRKDGSHLWAEVTVSAIRDPSGAPSHRVAIIHNVQDRKAAEEALRASEGRLRLALDAGRMAVWESDPARNSITISVELNRLLGFPEDASPSIEEIRSRYAPGARERLRSAAAAALAAGERYAEEELEIVLPDGTRRWLLLRAELEVSAGPDGAVLTKATGVALDITNRKRSEEHQRLLIHELNHRVKNTLATVQSIAAQTFRDVSTESRPMVRSFEERLFALARAHDVLTRENWEGAEMTEVITEVLEPYMREAGDRFDIDGPRLRLTPRTALALAMAIHELATNAAKYGALSMLAHGRVRIGWTVSDGDAPVFDLRWKETGGPPVFPPTRRGFGTRLIERMLADDLAGEVQLTFEPTGVLCIVRAPVPGFEPGARAAD